MELSDFMLTVSEVALNIIAKRELTIEEILDYLDQKQNFDKKTYSNTYSKIYNALRNLQYIIWETWHNYTTSEKYKSEFKKYEYYHQHKEDPWQNEYLKEIFDMGVFSKKQVEASIIEAKIFEDFIKHLKTQGIIFVIAGKGNKTYRIPDYHDYCYYKFNNLLTTTKTLHRQIFDFTSDGLLLPRGVSVSELDDLSGRVMKALDYKKEASS